VAAEQRVAVVTGASRGIGQAIARRLAADGMRVAVTARTRRPDSGRYAGSLEETVELIRAAGGVAAPITADLADPDARAGVVAAAEAALGGRVEVLVNNAAAERHFDLRFASMRADVFRESMEVNVWAAWDLALQALPGMVERGRGWILNISSRSAAPKVGPPYVLGELVAGQVLYGGSKAMLDRVTTGAAAELHGTGVAVNTLAPEAAVATDNAVAVARVDPRVSEPLETMAEAALALCTGDPATITGRVTYSLSLLVELDRPVRTLDGRDLVPGWQPHEIDPARLFPGYLRD
jgi:NAD(P)-dependent dehydrogenase (short-subunit alcohol dehydrogenase family)